MTNMELPLMDEKEATIEKETMMDLPLMDTLDTEKACKNAAATKEKMTSTELCRSILNTLLDNINLKKRKREEDILQHNNHITITKVQEPVKKIPTFRCMMCNAKIRFPPDSDSSISPRYNRAAKAKYRSHLAAEHNANSRYPGMELLVRTTFEQQFPSAFGNSGLIGNNGFVIPEKYRLPAFSQRPKAFEPKVMMQEEDMDDEEDDEIKAIKSSKEQKSGLQITVLDDDMDDTAAKEREEKAKAKKKELSELSKEVPITVESGEDSDGSEEESDEDSESDSSINSVEEDGEDEEEEEDDEFKEFKSMELSSVGKDDNRLPLPASIRESMELNSVGKGDNRLPLPASIREDLNLKYRKVTPTINKLTGLPFGWRKDVIRRAVGSPGFDIIIRNPMGKVFKAKSDLRKYCALYPNKTMGINPDAVFTSGLKPSKPVEVDLDDEKEDGDVECIDL